MAVADIVIFFIEDLTESVYTKNQIKWQEWATAKFLNHETNDMVYTMVGNIKPKPRIAQENLIWGAVQYATKWPEKSTVLL